jgi:hypothetical protein
VEQVIRDWRQSAASVPKAAARFVQWKVTDVDEF